MSPIRDIAPAQGLEESRNFNFRRLGSFRSVHCGIAAFSGSTMLRIQVLRFVTTLAGGKKFFWTSRLERVVLQSESDNRAIGNSSGLRTSTRDFAGEGSWAEVFATSRKHAP